jgi:hypothetical protein
LVPEKVSSVEVNILTSLPFASPPFKFLQYLIH